MVNIYLATDLRKQAEIKGINLSKLLQDSLKSILEIPDDEEQILKEIDELNQKKIFLNLKLQADKLKRGISFEEFLNNIQNSDSYTEKKKEIIIHDLQEIVQTVKINPNYTVPICRKMFVRHDLNIKPDQLRKWANEEHQTTQINSIKNDIKITPTNSKKTQKYTDEEFEKALFVD